MIIGPYLEIKCPSCGNLHELDSLLGSNNFGASYFSDGKCYAPMWREFPYFVKCKYDGCGVFFKISDSEYTGESRYKEFDFDDLDNNENEPIRPFLRSRNDQNWRRSVFWVREFRKRYYSR